LRPKAHRSTRSQNASGGEKSSRRRQAKRVSYDTKNGEVDPTEDQFGAYRLAFGYFNRALFDGTLPRCLLNFSRHSRFRGFFAHKRWRKGADLTNEISLNPDVLNRPLAESMATLVHEMVHHWQHEFGNPSRATYHNREWADRMESIGLMPSDTGQPGGKRTGQRVSHHIVPDGPFDRAFQVMPTEYKLPWLSGAPSSETKPKRADKLKYSCKGCNIAVWGKAELYIICGDCQERMESVDG
jgi:predicted SprT family Zn-dependent metalloprotease